MEKIYIPINVIENNEDKKWYMNISNLTLSQLIDLRDELIINADSVRVIDGVIKTCYLERLDYCKPEYRNAREHKKVRKREKMKMKRKCKERKDKR